LSDDQSAPTAHSLPGRPDHVGRNIDKGKRLFVEAVIWKLRSGAPRHDLPERFGDWKNTHERFPRWADSGAWESLFKTSADDPDNEHATIDATIARAHQHSAGART
jgi:transposase